MHNLKSTERVFMHFQTLKKPSKVSDTIASKEELRDDRCRGFFRPSAENEDCRPAETTCFGILQSPFANCTHTHKIGADGS